MRSRVLCLIMLLAAGCATRAPGPTTPEPDGAVVRERLLEPADALYFIDGETASRAEVEAFPRDSIARIEIIGGAVAVQRFGVNAHGGVMSVTTTRATTADPASTEPYYFINGRTASRAEFEALALETIERIQVVMGPTAVALYGASPDRGVFLVTTRDR